MSELTIDQALANIRAAQDELEAVLAARCPRGRRVHWKRGDHQQEGVVVRTARDRVEVQNSITLRTYFLDAWWLTAAGGGGVFDPKAEGEA